MDKPYVIALVHYDTLGVPDRVLCYEFAGKSRDWTDKKGWHCGDKYPLATMTQVRYMSRDEMDRTRPFGATRRPDQWVRTKPCSAKRIARNHKMVPTPWEN